MTRRRTGKRAAQHLWSQLTLAGHKAAADAAKKPALAALRLCLREIEQFHHTAYPKCAGGCPAHEAMDAARAALGDARSPSDRST